MVPAAPGGTSADAGVPEVTPLPAAVACAAAAPCAASAAAARPASHAWRASSASWLPDRPDANSPGSPRTSSTLGSEPGSRLTQTKPSSSQPTPDRNRRRAGERPSERRGAGPESRSWGAGPESWEVASSHALTAQTGVHRATGTLPASSPLGYSLEGRQRMGGYGHEHRHHLGAARGPDGTGDGRPCGPVPNAPVLAVDRLHRKQGGLGRVAADLHPGGLERLRLGLGRAARAGDDRAGVPHAPARGCLEAGDVGDHRLGHPFGHEAGGLLLLVAADLADHHHRLGLRVGLEAGQHVDEVRPDHRVAADAHRGGLPDPGLGHLVHHLVGERAGAGDQAHRPAVGDLAGDDADVGLAGRDHPGAVGPDQRDALGAHVVPRPGHVEHGDVLGDQHDRADAGVDRLVERVDREAGGHEDQRGVGAALGDRVGHGVEHRDALDLLAGLARRDAGDHVGAVGAVAQRVEAALAAGEALDDEPGVGVDEDGHGYASPLVAPASSTALAAASSMVAAGTTFSDGEAASSRLPSSALVPSSRTTRGTWSLSPRRSRASRMPWATRSPRVMPPKMLTSTLRTLGSERITSRPEAIVSAEAPPPTSRKLAALPPAWATTSRVDITRPAPLPMMPTWPSSLM